MMWTMLRSRSGRCLGLALCLLLALAACREPDTVPVETSDMPAEARLSPTVYVSDPVSEGQLKSGFHSVEQNAWRWTEKQFSVVLGVPEGADQSGAVLEFQLAVPDAVIQKLQSVTLSATVGGVSLAPETYSRAGEYVYTRQIPPAALAGDAVTIEFALDRAIPAGETDRRELGVIATSFVLRLP